MSTSHPTPVYSHLKCPAYRDVYEPAEDTFLFMDALDKESSFIGQLKSVMASRMSARVG